MEVNNSYKFLISTITEALDMYASIKTIKIRNDDRFREGWLTVSLRKHNQKSRKLCNKARKYGPEKDFKKISTTAML